MKQGLVIGLATVAIALAACGSGNDKTEPRTVTETATQAPAAGLAAERLTSLDARDTELQNAIEKLQDSSAACLGGSDAEVSACFVRKYRPYGEAIEAMQEEMNTAQAVASGACAGLLEEAEDPLTDLGSVSDNLRVSFDVGEYDDAPIDELAATFARYRDAMDEALGGCSS